MLLRIVYFLTIVTFSSYSSATDEKPPADTGISGVYEVLIGTDNAKPLISLLNEFGFKVVDEGQLTAAQAKGLYGVDSALQSFRLQNGEVDSHGLIRILQWHNLLGDGVGYAQPETIGQRMMVMRTKDIIRLHDIFSDARQSGEKWLATTPVYDDLYAMTEGKLNVVNRRIGVREMAVYGELINMVFFQRYGYTIPGYGVINTTTPLQTSEITHNDFVLPGHTKADLAKQTDYYRDVLGFKPEGPIVLDGDWQQGPKKVFNMADGASHWYRGFVSPNNIAGKLKFFVSPDNRPDRSYGQQLGHKGITGHSLYTRDLNKVFELAQSHAITVSSIADNEFGEQTFVLHGPDGSTWQIIKKARVKKAPLTTLTFEKTGQ